LSELKEIQVEAYKSARMFKEWAMLVYDMMILRKDFAPSINVLLFDLRLHIFLGKIRSH